MQAGEETLLPPDTNKHMDSEDNEHNPNKNTNTVLTKNEAGWAVWFRQEKFPQNKKLQSSEATRYAERTEGWNAETQSESRLLYSSGTNLRNRLHLSLNSSVPPLQNEGLPVALWATIQ